MNSSERKDVRTFMHDLFVEAAATIVGARRSKKS